MKKSLNKIALILISISTLGCSNNEIESYTISGKVVDYNSGNAAANVNLKIQTSLKSSGINIFGSISDTSNEFEVKNVLTDQNGNFSVSFKKIKNIEGIMIQNFNDGNFVGKFESLPIKDFQNIIFKIYKLETLKIIVRNINPLNSNDKIRFSPPSNFLVNRINFGVQNETEIDVNGNITQLNEWKGINVSSEITYKVNPFYDGELKADVTKNGISTLIYSTTITIVPNQINTINFDY